ncbi:MAG: hypothetical protein DME97_02300 [Verrucomicrobia bacterium]|nr:MAG: hypothetical protein DME97_02300 [Verrucomicrobiota bacterium]
MVFFGDGSAAINATDERHAARVIENQVGNFTLSTVLTGRPFKCSKKKRGPDAEPRPHEIDGQRRRYRH